MFFYESELLKCLEFNTSRILAIDFLNYFAEDAGFDFKNKRYYYCLYLLNISYLSLKLRSISQSLLAFSIVYFVNRIFSREQEWPLTRVGSSTNLLKNSTKKLAFLTVNRRFEEWEKAKQSYQNKFLSALDEIARIGESSQLSNNFIIKDCRFLSKISNSITNEDSRRNLPSERSFFDKDNKINLNSMENSKQTNFITDPRTKSVFTIKNVKKIEDENKSTGISQMHKRPNIPNSKISAFDITLNKPQNLIQGTESLAEGSNKTLKKPILYKNIEFDFSKVKSIALDVFNGTPYPLIPSHTISSPYHTV